MRISLFHLYNDYSGSPKVLRSVIESLLDRGHTLSVVTSEGNGALDNVTQNGNIKYDYLYYHPHKNRLVWVLVFVWAQIVLFFKALKHKESSIFYINTLMPVGAAFAGRVLNKRIVYHYHENAFAKSASYRFLCRIMLALADEIICVSNYQRSFLPESKKIVVVPNALPKSFTESLKPCASDAYECKNILMISSLVVYKGIVEFLELAGQLGEYKFTLVINETDRAIAKFVAEHKLVIPENVQLFPRQSDVSPFYNAASLLLNLSNREKAIETFGMTVLEGLAAGVPVIVPTVGGIAELVEDGFNGYKIDVQDLNLIAAKITEIFQNKELYYKLAEGALATASKYSLEQMNNKIEAILLSNY